MEAEITNVDNERNTIIIKEDGEEREVKVVEPANIKYAKEGNAELGFDNTGCVKYLKMTGGFKNATQYAPAPKTKGKVKVLRTIKLTEFEKTYNEFDGDISATQIFPRGEDKYDVVIYYK